MKRKLIALDLALVAAIGAAGWRLRQDWVAMRAREHRLQFRSAKAGPSQELRVAPAPQPVAAVGYAEIAQKTLLSRDRNPDVVVEVEQPKPKPMPPLPVLYGVMNLLDSTTVVMSENPAAPHHGIRLGEQIGPFKLVAVNREDITFDWDGQEITKKIDDMLVRQPAPPPPSNVPAKPSPPARVEGAPVPKADPVPGADIGGGIKACQAGDSSAAGTVSGGYRKSVTTTPFGSICRWESIEKSQ